MTKINLTPPGRYRKTAYAAFLEDRLFISNHPFKGVTNAVVQLGPVVDPHGDHVPEEPR